MKPILMITFLALFTILASGGCDPKQDAQSPDSTGPAVQETKTADPTLIASSVGLTQNSHIEDIPELANPTEIDCGDISSLDILKAGFVALSGVPASTTVFVPLASIMPTSIAPENIEAVELMTPTATHLTALETPGVAQALPDPPTVQPPLILTPERLQDLAPQLNEMELDTTRNFTQQPLIGGSPITDKSNNPYEWAALLVMNRDGTSIPFCSGALVDKRVVLTAAHCARILQGGDVIFIGGTNFSSDPGDARFVTATATHQCFDATDRVHDIALVRLSADVENEPLKLTTADTTLDVPPGQALVVSWGKGSPASGINGVGVLQELTLPLVELEECNALYPLDNLSNRMVCAGTTGHTTCNGDSGGPLVASNDGELELIGTASKTISCLEPGVFSRVSAYMTWLDGEIKN